MNDSAQAPMIISSAAQFMDLPAGPLGQSGWMLVDQGSIDRFALATNDHQWIHVDRSRATREMPGSKTIAHGFLSLALLPQMLDDIIQFENLGRGLNYGLDGVRFLNPVQEGSRIRLSIALTGIEAKSNAAIKATYDCNCEIEGAAKPAFVAKFIGLYEFER